MAQERFDRRTAHGGNGSGGVGQQRGDGTGDDGADRRGVGAARTEDGLCDQFAEVAGHRGICRRRARPGRRELTGEDVDRARHSGTELVLHGGGAQERGQFIADRYPDHADQGRFEVEIIDDEVVEEFTQLKEVGR